MELDLSALVNRLRQLTETVLTQTGRADVQTLRNVAISQSVITQLVLVALKTGDTTENAARQAEYALKHMLDITVQKDIQQPWYVD